MSLAIQLSSIVLWGEMKGMHTIIIAEVAKQSVTFLSGNCFMNYQKTNTTGESRVGILVVQSCCY